MSNEWKSADAEVCREIRHAASVAARDIQADFAVTVEPTLATVPLLDDVLEEYARNDKFLGAGRLFEMARNLGLLLGEIVVAAKRGRWVVDDGAGRLALRLGPQATIDPVAWALERLGDPKAGLSRRLEASLGAAG